MIHSITHHSAVIAAESAPQLTTERPGQQLEPAVQVTSAEEVLSSKLPAGKSQPSAAGPGKQTFALEKALEQANDQLKAWSTGMRFDVDEDTQRVVISIVNAQTEEVLRTIPSDAVLRVAKMIVQLQGTGIDTKV